MILIAELFTKKNSGEIARKRLKHLLTADRAGCSPELLDPVSYTHLRAHETRFPEERVTLSGD